MPRVQIVLENRQIRVAGGLLGRVLNGSPCVGDETIQVIDRFDARPPVGAKEEHGPGSEERFHKIRHVPEPAPDLGGDEALPSKPGEGRAQ